MKKNIPTQHLPVITVNTISTARTDHGHSCKKYECCDDLVKFDVVVWICMVNMFVSRRGEKLAMEVHFISDVLQRQQLNFPSLLHKMLVTHHLWYSRGTGSRGLKQIRQQKQL